MNFGKQADRIIEHPYFRMCVVDYLEGNVGDLKILLIDLMTHVSTLQNAADKRAYSKTSSSTHPIICEAIKSQVCMVNCNFSLPIPFVSEDRLNPVRLVIMEDGKNKGDD